MRRAESMEPTPIRLSKPAEEIRRALRGMGEILEPKDAEEPILAPPVRAAVFGWMAELNAAAELAEVRVKPRATGLLYGPPGCGKTTLAHHLAARRGVPLVLVGAENIFGAYLGESEKSIARLFDTLSDIQTECVLMLDEIDAIGGRRDANRAGGADNARTAALTVLLRKIEGFDGLLIAATNRADDIDPALWRRFGMQIDVALPDFDTRWAILKRYAAPFSIDDAMLDFLAEATDGAAPSLLRQMMEGLKRALVLGQRLRLPVDNPRALFAGIVAQVAPHPDYQPPRLWAQPESINEMPVVAWPPPRAG